MKQSEIIADLRAELERERDQRRGAQTEARDALSREKETRAQFDDLKARLHNAELENATMRGYIDRAQEDDHAREELVKVGDPDGEQQLVPKRKHRCFPVRMIQGGALDSALIRHEATWRDHNGTPRRPKHWVNY